MSSYYTARVRLVDGNWHEMNVYDDAPPYRFATLVIVEASIRKCVSLDGCIEGTVHDDQGEVVQRWVAGAWRSEAVLMEPVCSAT